MAVRSLLQMAVASLVLNVAFGSSRQYDDPYMLAVMYAMNLTIQVCGGSGPLTVFPILRYLPGDPFLLHCTLEANDMNRVLHRQHIEVIK